MADLKKIGNLLVLLGGIVGIIEGIMQILLIGGSGFINPLGAILGPFVTGVLGILFSLIALVNSGFIKIPALDFGKKNKFIVVLIIGVLMLLFASNLGGILVVIGAILWML